MSKFKSSEWRQSTVVVPAGEYYEMNFLDTQPNVFWIQNLNNSQLYASLANVPTLERYEYEIKPNRADCFGRPLASSRLYLLNPSENAMSVTVFSNFQEFDIGLLKDLYVEIDTSQFKYDGKITGFAPGVEMVVKTKAGQPLEISGYKLDTIDTTLSGIQTFLSSNWGTGSFAEKNSPLILDKLTTLTTYITTHWADGTLVEKNSDAIKSNTDTLKTDTADIKSYSNVIMTNVQSIKLVADTIYTKLSDFFTYVTSHWTDGTLKEKNSDSILSAVTTSKNTLDDISAYMSPSVANGSTYIYDQYTLTTQTKAYSTFNPSVLKMLTNDGAEHLKLIFRQGASTVKFSMIIKPGETITDFPVVGDTVIVDKDTSTMVSYRIAILTP